MGAATVPYPYDLVIGSTGFILADYLQDSEPSVYGQTPTFVQRQNTQGDYGDNQQDFWLTWSQKDWSKGGQQKYQGREDDGKSRYWDGSAITVETPGEVSMSTDTAGITFAAAPKSCVASASADLVYVTT